MCSNFACIKLPGQIGDAGCLPVYRAGDAEAGSLQRMPVCLGKGSQDSFQGSILLARVIGLEGDMRLPAADINHCQTGIGAADIAGKYVFFRIAHLVAGLDRCNIETLNACNDFLVRRLTVFPALDIDPLVGLEILVVIEEVRDLVE